MKNELLVDASDLRRMNFRDKLNIGFFVFNLFVVPLSTYIVQDLHKHTDIFREQMRNHIQVIDQQLATLVTQEQHSQEIMQLTSFIIDLQRDLADKKLGK